VSVAGRVGGRAAIVTGGGRSGDEMSIGRSIALLLAREGAHVGVLDVNVEAARETVAEIQGEGGAALAIQGDVTSEDECRRAVGELLEQAERLDILVNNVGITAGAGLITEVDGAAWDRAMDVNAKGAFFMTKHAVPAMTGGGSIVNISSIATIRPRHGTVYAISKKALEELTLATAVQFGAQGVRANNVLPGEVWTELMARIYPNAEEAARWRELRRRRSLLGTEGDAWDIAHAVLFLASDEARWITAQTLVVDGGITARDVRDAP
jgi:NAD(P)-dependent dehydrogenase (short-subunit alcohol dehydrogenase family)